MKFKHQQHSDDIFVTNLQKLMRKKTISEAGLSRETGIPQPTLHKILSGKTSDPRISTLKELAVYFDTTLDGLYSHNLSYGSELTPKGYFAPIFSWNDCINPGATNLQGTNQQKTYWINTKKTHDSDYFILISKPCMEPYFRQGTLLIVDRNQQPADGDIVIISYPNTSEATMRTLHIDGPDQKLSNPYKAGLEDDLTSDKKILGTLIESRFEHKINE